MTAQEAKSKLEFTFFMLNCGRTKEAESALEKVFDYFIEQTQKELENTK